MKTLFTIITKYWKLILIILLGFVVYWFYTLIQDLKEDNKRLMNNFEQVMLDNNAKILELTKKELKRYNTDTLFKKLKDSLNLKYRMIERTINHKYHYVYDTLIAMTYTFDDSVRTFKHSFDNCVSVTGEVDWGKNRLSFDSLSVNYNSTSIYYWQRPHKFWFIRYGKKRNFVSTMNNCNSKSNVTEINIVKRNNN